MSFRVIAIVLAVTSLTVGDAFRLRTHKHEVESSNAGQCTEADQSIINSMGPGNSVGSWPRFVKDCTDKSVRIFPPAWKGHDGMVNCIQEEQVSKGCATCFADMSKYGFDNCKAACLFSWCSEGCLQCTRGNEEANSKLQECTGMVDIPQPEQCSGGSEAGVSEESSNAGQCTEADQSIINSMGPGNAVGSWARFVKDCTDKSVRIFPPAWKGHDGMVNCIHEEQVSKGCATCFADMSKYGFDNCKAACLFSWCSAGCLDCTGGNKDANDKLKECAGMVDIPQPDQC